MRGKIHDYAGLGASSRNRLKDKVLQLREANNPEYRELLTEPSFLEDLQILVKNYGIDSLGYIVWDRWCLWQPTIEELRNLRGERSVFENFEKLAEQMKQNLPHLPDVGKPVAERGRRCNSTRSLT